MIYVIGAGAACLGIAVGILLGHRHKEVLTYQQLQDEVWRLEELMRGRPTPGAELLMAEMTVRLEAAARRIERKNRWRARRERWRLMPRRWRRHFSEDGSGEARRYARRR